MDSRTLLQVDERRRQLTARAAGQLGLLTVRQAINSGMTQDVLERRVGRGEFERVGRGVLAIAGMPWTWERRAEAVLLALGPDARLSHRAAAHVLGFDGFGACAVEVTVTRGRSVRSPLAVVHTTAANSRLDVIRVGRFRATSGSRTIIDLCGAGVSEDQLSAAIGSAIRDGHTSEVFLRKRLAALRGRGRCGVRLLDRVLEGPIAHSHLERTFLRLVRQARMPAPQTQVILRGERVMRVDASWLDAMLVVEVMGHRFHVTRTDLQRDAHRRNELQEMGFLVIELTTDDLADRPAQSMDRVRRNLIARLPAPFV